MDNTRIFILTLICVLISYYLYFNVFESICNEQIHPLIDRKKKGLNRKRLINKQVWTYIEDPIFYDKDLHLQLLDKDKNVPILFNLSLQILNDKIKKNSDLIVITPYNIGYYFDDFPIEMNAKSKYSQKFRVDLLASFILSKYGGLFVSPGTIVLQNLDEILYNIKYKYDLITFGGSIRNINSCNDKNNPGNYIIGSKHSNPTILGYKKRMLENLNEQGYVDNLVGEDLLSDSIHENEPVNYFHFNCEYTGNIDIRNNVIGLDHYFGYEPIDFKNKEKLIFISLPYDQILYNKKYFWINNLSKQQFIEANTAMTKIISEEILK